MQSDPYVILEIEARKLERASDRASVQRNRAAAWHLQQKLYAVSRVQEATSPTTARGAALVLSDVLILLDEKEEEELSACDHYIIQHLRPIIRRFKRNERRLDDLMTLRVLLEMVRKEYGALNPYLDEDENWQFGRLPQWIEKALRAAAAPVLASTRSPWEKELIG